MKIYFYPHTYLRDRQLDTIRNWPKNEVLNPLVAENRKGAQVSKSLATSPKIQMSWKQKIPLLNVKRRPAGLTPDSVVYVWGGLIASGKFIVDIDNPWALVGYNLRAMPLYRTIIRHILLSARCVEIRCLSQACLESLRLLFGEYVGQKAVVCYPKLQLRIEHIPQDRGSNVCRFLFIGTQFEIKGGSALLRAFDQLYRQHPDCHLDIITHLPEDLASLVGECAGISVHEAKFSRDEIYEKFMQTSDVLILPTYVESFGMVVLEALSHGLAVITTDVYALSEMVEQDVNGVVIQPPISVWDGYLPSDIYRDLANVKEYIRTVNTVEFEEELSKAMARFVVDVTWRYQARQASLDIFLEKFSS